MFRGQRRKPKLPKFLLRQGKGESFAGSAVGYTDTAAVTKATRGDPAQHGGIVGVCVDAYPAADALAESERGIGYTADCAVGSQTVDCAVGQIVGPGSVDF